MRSNSNRHSARYSTRRNVLLTAAVLAAVSQSNPALGGDCFWDGTTNSNWTFSPNWTGGTPGGFDVAYFDAFIGVARNVIAIDSSSTVGSMFIDGVPPPGAYEYQSIGNSQLFVGGDLTIAGLAANSTPVTFNNLNLDAGRLVLGANGTLNVAGATTLHAANGLEVFGVMNWQSGAVIQSPGSTFFVNPGGVVNVNTGTGRGLGDGVTLSINNGSFTSNTYFDIGSSLDVGNGPSGTLLVSGSNARYVQTGGAFSAWSHNATDFATVTFDNQAIGTLSAGLSIGGNGGGAIVSVKNGARLTVGDHLSVGILPPAPLSGGGRAQPEGQLYGSAAGNGPLIVVDGGTLVVNGAATFASGATVNYSAGSLNINGLLTTRSNAQMFVTAGANRVLRVAGISMNDTSKIDLNDNDMIVGSLTTKASVENLVRAARNGGAWNGAVGITSTAAKNHAQHITTLGVLGGGEFKSLYGGAALFSGQTVAETDKLIKYTYYGDSDFNGKVDGSDYARLDAKFNQQAGSGNIGGWLNGDSDFNGKLDGADYALIDAAFNAQGNTVLRAGQFLSGDNRDRSDMTGAALGMVLEHFDQFGDVYGQAFLSAVPEPTAAMLFPSLAGLCLIRRRRRCG